MSAAERLLIAKHGTLQEFARACWVAESQLFITNEECRAAISKYRRELEEARKQK